jgi:KDO2-lipid IV(A) lauroyltransferase
LSTVTSSTIGRTAPVADRPLPQAGAEATSLLRYAGPRYWLTWVFLGWLRFSAALPWRTSIKLHKFLGRVAGGLLSGRLRIVRRNLEICFPHLQPHEIESLARRHFENVAAFLPEMANTWFGSADRIAHLFRIEGVEHLRAALAKGNGVMLFSGHFTTLEICVPIIKTMVPLYAFMFRARHNPLVNAMQRRGRQRAAHASFGNNDVRAMLRMLRKNAVVWYAPDQAPGSGGELLSFFGEPAMTNTATSRLARVSGAAVVPLFFMRLPDDSGYVLRFHAPLDNLPSGDAVRDTARLTAVLEDFVRECPEQYFWTHRKFKSRPADLPDAYNRSN